MRWVGALFAIALSVTGVAALRDATQSTHQPVDPETRIELVIHAAVHGGEPGQTLTEQVEALVSACRLEVSSDLTGPGEALGAGRFRFVLQPSMDETDRRQFTGCVEDWAIDHVRADVERLAPVA